MPKKRVPLIATLLAVVLILALVAVSSRVQVGGYGHDHDCAERDDGDRGDNDVRDWDCDDPRPGHWDDQARHEHRDHVDGRSRRAGVRQLQDLHPVPRRLQRLPRYEQGAEEQLQPRTPPQQGVQVRGLPRHSDAPAGQDRQAADDHVLQVSRPGGRGEGPRRLWSVPPGELPACPGESHRRELDAGRGSRGRTSRR